jgi:[glutamine synthetase] adenylyltransferase / [glutamine synthetase]-adenylyl-L-tyrosine phosphorylase
VNSAPALAEELSAAAVDDPERLLRRFDTLWPDGAAPPPMRAALAQTANPEHAVAALGRLRDAEPKALATIQADAVLARNLVVVLGASPLAARLLLADPSAWTEVLAATSAATPLPTIVPPPSLAPGISADDLARALRTFKQRRLLRIAVRDLLRFATLEETTAALTELAEHALDAALMATRAALVAEYGNVVDDTGPVGFVVLGMGKLGGVELNFSSDIDLVYLYARDGLESAGGPRA